MGTLRFFEEVVSFKIRRTFGFADYRSILFKSGLEKNISKLGYNRSSKARMGLSKYNQ